MHLSEACACRWCRPGHRARHGESRRSRSRETPGPRSPAQKPEPKKKKRRQPEFAQMIHAAPAYAMLSIAAIPSYDLGCRRNSCSGSAQWSSQR